MQSFPVFLAPPARTPLPGTHVYLLENSRLGFEPFVTAQQPGLPPGNQQNALGFPAELRQTHVGSRSTGKERDAESGLDYFGARYFSGAQGRFSSPDAPFNDQDPSDPQSWNLYSYVRNNPLSNTDPNGTTCQTASNGSKYDDLDGKGCADVVIGDVLTSPSATAKATTDDVSYQLASGVASQTSTSSVSGVVANGMMGAQIVEGIWSLPNLLRSGWDLIAGLRMSSKMAGVQAAGKAGEALAGIVKNTERIPSVTGASYRVPDILDHANKVIGEVKNYTTTTVSLTAQIKDDLAYAAQNGYTMELRVRQGTQLSQPVQQLVNQGKITLSTF